MNKPNTNVSDIIARLLTTPASEPIEVVAILLTDEEEDILDGMLGADLEVDATTTSSAEAVEYFGKLYGFVDHVDEDDSDDYQAMDYDDNGDLIIAEISHLDERTGIRTYTIVTQTT